MTMCRLSDEESTLEDSDPPRIDALVMMICTNMSVSLERKLLNNGGSQC